MFVYVQKFCFLACLTQTPPRLACPGAAPPLEGQNYVQVREGEKTRRRLVTLTLAGKEGQDGSNLILRLGGAG